MYFWLDFYGTIESNVVFILSSLKNKKCCNFPLSRNNKLGGCNLQASLCLKCNVARQAKLRKINQLLLHESRI